MSSTLCGNAVLSLSEFFTKFERRLQLLPDDVFDNLLTDCFTFGEFRYDNAFDPKSATFSLTKSFPLFIALLKVLDPKSVTLFRRVSFVHEVRSVMSLTSDITLLASDFTILEATLPALLNALCSRNEQSFCLILSLCQYFHTE